MSGQNSATEPALDPALAEYLQTLGVKITSEQFADHLAKKAEAAAAADKAHLDALEAKAAEIITQLEADEDVLDIVLRHFAAQAQQARASRGTKPAKAPAGATRTLNCAGTACPQPNKQWEAPVQQGRVPQLCPICKAANAKPTKTGKTKAGRPRMHAIDPHDFGPQGEPKNKAEAKFRLKHEKNPTHAAAVERWLKNQKKPIGRSQTVRHPASKVGKSFRQPTEAPKAAGAY